MDRSNLRRLLLASVLGLLGSGLGIGFALAGAPSGQPVAKTQSQRSRPIHGSSVTTAPPVATTTVPSPPSVALPASYLFDQISIVNGGLFLSGELASTASSLTPACASATVDPQTLVVGSETGENCDNPALSGEAVGVVNSNMPDSNNGTISISYQNPETGQVTVGPVVMTFASLSDTRPVMAYGGGWMWIYDNSVLEGSAAATGSNPGVAELLQISSSTGQVVNSVSMPVLFKPLMAANDEGLWIGNSIEGGVCSGCAPPSALYFVAPGSSTSEVMISSSTTDVCWLTGSQDVLWLGVTSTQQRGCQTQMTIRLDGTDPQPTFEVPDQGYEPITVIGSDSQGLWTIQWSNPRTYSVTQTSPQEVVNIDPDTGSEHVVATLPPLVIPIGREGGLSAGQAVIFDGSMYLLEPPLIHGLGYSSVVRVALSDP